ncbi:vitamin K epoxide reductase family protein [Candidatus Woesearchaeota archaeon]|nr:vitamin K epoxide reductase family protein [Candidatus Woesearchaeota archaeon]
MNKKIAWFVVLLAFLGILLTFYLTWLHYNPPAPDEEILGCLTGSGCSAVTTSEYSYFLGIPVAVLGLVTYIIIFLLSILFLFLKSEEKRKEQVSMIILLLSFIGTLFQAYLTYLSATIIRAYCSLCITSEVFITLIFVLSCILNKEKLKMIWERYVE